MRRRIGLLASCLALFALTTTVASASAMASSQVKCAQTEQTTIPPNGSPTSPPQTPSEPPCWEEIQPYPFGYDGGYVGEPGASSAECELGASNPEPCYLTVTSMDFRAWNRGLAAVARVAGESTSKTIPYAVWIFDGTHWEPDFTFPGNTTCPGNTIVWAGKLDYWLVGGETKRLCRFDGAELHWVPLELPPATLAHMGGRPGGITSAACFAWNNCWFFGTYGAVVHWNGEKLEDASPPSSEGWLQGEYTAAVAHENPAGEPYGVAVGADTERLSSTEKLPQQPDGAAAPQIYGSRGGAFSPVLFAPLFSNPFGADLVAADFDTAEDGWVAGNPAGLRLREREGHEPPAEGDPAYAAPAASPLEPVSASGASTACKAPAPNFGYRTPGAPDPAGSFLWSSISIVPSSGEALAGGNMRQQDPKFGEPVIAQVSCDGAATLTRFRVAEGGSNSPLVPADREGGVTAIAANATNDAWAATSKGVLSGTQPPRLYRLRNGLPPAAPEGDNKEEGRLSLKEEIPPPPPEPPQEEEPAPTPTPTPSSVTQLPSITLPPAIYDVKVKLHKVKRHGRTYLSLYLTFKVLRPVKVGAEALRHGRVVSRARARLFSGRTGELILSVERKRWPTNVSFVS